MKMKIARKQMVQLPHLYRAGYCSAQYLLTGLEPVAYTAGKYGWDCDVYTLPGGVYICTGYRGLAGDNIPDLAEWETAASNIIRSDYWSADKLNTLRNELVATLLAQGVQT